MIDDETIKENNASVINNAEVKVEKLIEDSKAWDGSALVAYPTSAPELSIFKYIFPPHSVTKSHLHNVLNCGVVLKGVLTVVSDKGEEKDFHPGEAIIEMTGKIHHGENRGDEIVELIMFYAGDGITPLSC